MFSMSSDRRRSGGRSCRGVQRPAVWADLLQLARLLDAPGAHYQIYLNRGDVRLMREDFQDARQDCVAAVGIVETLRTRFVAAADALAYFDETRLEVYDRLVQFYARVWQNPAEVFQWNERARARTFLQQLRLGALERPAGIDAAPIDPETELLHTNFAHTEA
jgi:hypothetical protein